MGSGKKTHQGPLRFQLYPIMSNMFQIGVLYLSLFVRMICVQIVYRYHVAARIWQQQMSIEHLGKPAAHQHQVAAWISFDSGVDPRI